MQDISWSREGMHYFVKQSKLTKWAEVPPFLLGRTHQCTCPVAAMEAYVRCCGCSATRHHSSITGMFFPSTFPHLIRQCGFDAAKFNTHSLHIGAAITAAFRHYSEAGQNKGGMGSTMLFVLIVRICCCQTPKHYYR